MPIYEYQCESCENRFERLQRFDDPPVATCEECGGPVRKLISAPAFQFKGSGWYVTDYARKGSTGGASDNSGKTETSTKSESKADDKPAKKKETKTAASS